MADYSKSCKEVYVDVARAFLKNGDLEILAMCRSPGDILGLPSWVPDWTAPILIPWMGMPRDELFAASADTQHSFIPSAQDGTVTLKGVRVDTILEYGHARIGDPPMIEKGDTVEKLQKALLDVENFVRRGGMISNENRADAIWRISIADQEFTPGGLQLRRRATAISEGHYRDLRRVLGIPIDGETPRDGYDGGLEFGSYLIRMREIHNSRPFLSEKGYVGHAPADAEVGDLVCILFGAPVPFVLRKTDSGRYRLMGEAFVYGIMDGEFLTKGDVVSEEFVLH